MQGCSKRAVLAVCAENGTVRGDVIILSKHASIVLPPKTRLADLQKPVGLAPQYGLLKCCEHDLQAAHAELQQCEARVRCCQGLRWLVCWHAGSAGHSSLHSAEMLRCHCSIPQLVFVAFAASSTISGRA